MTDTHGRYLVESHFNGRMQVLAFASLCILAGPACQQKGVSKVTVNGATGTVDVVLKASDYERSAMPNAIMSKRLVAVVHGISKQYPSLDTLYMNIYLDRNTHTDAFGNPLDKDKYAGTGGVDPAKYGKYVSPEFICEKAGWLGMFVILPLPESVRNASAPRSAAASNVKESAPAWSAKEEAEAEEVATLLAKAHGRRTAGLLDEARASVKQALAIQPDNAEAERLLEEVDADIAVKAAKAKKAAEYRKWMNEGRRLRREGKLSESADAFTMANTVMPESRDANRELSALRDEIKKKRVADARKKEYDRCMAEALQLREAGKLSQAAQAYDDAAKIDQKDPQRARLKAAECRHDDLARQAASLAKNGDLKKAASLYSKALKEKGNIDTLRALRRVLERIKDEERAEEARMRAAVEAARAERRAEERRKKAAEEAARTAAYQNAMKAARTLGRDKEWEDVVRVLEFAFANKPGDPDALKLLAAVPRHTLTIDLGEDVNLDLVYIGPGTFTMGLDWPEDRTEQHRFSRVSNRGSSPAHEVVITKAFYIGKYEVTQKQFERIRGRSSRRFSYPGDDKPVDRVIVREAVEFCEKLAKVTKRRFRLPTEAEWEYACRAGSKGVFFFGDDGRWQDKMGAYAWWLGNSGNPYTGTRPVGQKKPNAWGLYDMYGNVSELCLDWYDEKYYANSPRTDPRGPETGRVPVMRGGNSVRRFGYFRNTNTVGFRVVLSPTEAP